MGSDVEDAKNLLKKKLASILSNTDKVLHDVNDIIISASVKIDEDVEVPSKTYSSSYITTLKTMEKKDRNGFVMPCIRYLDSVSVKTKEGAASVLTQIYSILDGNVYIVDLKKDEVNAMEGLNIDNKGIYHALKKYDNARKNCSIVYSLANTVFGYDEKYNHTYV